MRDKLLRAVATLQDYASHISPLQDQWEQLLGPPDAAEPLVDCFWRSLLHLAVSEIKEWCVCARAKAMGTAPVLHLHYAGQFRCMHHRTQAAHIRLKW